MKLAYYEIPKYYASQYKAPRIITVLLIADGHKIQ